jgi:phosphatidylserine decarboxylase
MKKPELPIAREGFPFIFFCGFCTLIFSLLGYPAAALVGLTVTAFVTWFFRDPFRIQPEDSDAVVCPADGKVIIIDEIFDDRFLQQQVIKISIFMNVFNVHVNRIPFPGSVQQVILKAGKFYSADKKKAALHNEYCAMIIATASGQQYGIVQVAGLIARRIICWIQRGDQVITGQRYGLIRFGSRVDLYLPLDTKIEVKLGQKVRAGETILARMKV